MAAQAPRLKLRWPPRRRCHQQRRKAPCHVQCQVPSAGQVRGLPAPPRDGQGDEDRNRRERSRSPEVDQRFDARVLPCLGPLKGQGDEVREERVRG
eukprot:2407532-Pyramimonas_sp.AAC.1